MTKLTMFRAGWGALLLARPQIVLARLGGDCSGALRATARILGARHLGEAVLISLRRADSPPPRLPMAIDLLHALSMLALARFIPRVRRDALASAAMSGALGGVSELERRSGRR